jgi:hypothetical protein
VAIMRPDHAMAIQHCLEVAFPEGLIPPTEGGSVFLELSLITGMKEAHISEYAKSLGFWPYTSVQLEAVYRTRNFPEKPLAELVREEANR